jgi:hypothetical protein
MLNNLINAAHHGAEGTEPLAIKTRVVVDIDEKVGAAGVWRRLSGESDTAHGVALGDRVVQYWCRPLVVQRWSACGTHSGSTRQEGRPVAALD